MREVLVTGASGFIGGRLADRLASQGERVRVLVRDPARLPPALAARVSVHVGDLCDSAAVAAALAPGPISSPDTVIHCAADVKTWDRAAAYHRSNVEATRTLVDAMRGAGAVRLVHVSTVDVYDFPETPATEAMPAGAPRFDYGRTKLEAERVVQAAVRDGLQATVIRPCNVMGAGSPFVSRIGAALKGGHMLTIDGGRAHAGLLDVDSLVEVLAWAARDPRAVGATYNVRDPIDASWSTFLARLAAALGVRGRCIDLPFGLALGVARGMAAAGRRLAPDREPLLHPLIVHIFGRTCGHVADRVWADSGLRGCADLDELVLRCVGVNAADARRADDPAGAQAQQRGDPS